MLRLPQFQSYRCPHSHLTAHCAAPPAKMSEPGHWLVIYRVVLLNDLSVSQPVFTTITEKAPTRAFSWLKEPSSAFTFKTKALVGAFSVIVQLHQWIDLRH